MIRIDDKLISEDLAEVEFVCNLTACKGQCCVSGDAGAPLKKEELPILEEIWPLVKPYLDEEHQQAVEQEGVWVEDIDGEYVTPLRDGKECAYVVFEEGYALCGIEKAFRDGKIDWPKPISCHLYPVRVHAFKNLKMEALNYDRWEICNPACDHGKKLGVPVYKFLKEPLIRAFGEKFYHRLSEAIEELRNNSED